MEKITLRVSHQIIPSISEQYSSVPHRVIMEFIDNSLDSAEEFFNIKDNSYNKPIKIQIEINRNVEEPYIKVSDNCTGILDIERVVKEIGNSDKKTNRWTNGQFGFGIYSFMAIAGSLHIYTRNKNMLYSGCQFLLKRSFFEQDMAPEIEVHSYGMQELGTVIKLSDFNEGLFNEITPESIKKDIQSHFEQLLERKNLEMVLITNGIADRCTSFDYSQIDGEEIKEEIYDLILDKNGARKPLALLGKPPIKIYLKVTKNITLDRPPVFIAKGRRINEIKHIVSFKSFNKSKVWGHPNITGYIDLGDVLIPQLDRKDFVVNKEAKAVYKALINLEEDLLEKINKITQESETRNFKRLEDYLNSILSKLAKEDSIKFNDQFSPNGDVSLSPTGVPEDFSDDALGGKDHGTDVPTNNKGKGIGLNEDAEGKGTAPSETGVYPGDLGGIGPANIADFMDSDFKGKSVNKKSGLNIEIIAGEPQVNLDGTLNRSNCVDGCIRIYKEHPDFKVRLAKDRTGRIIITQQLITYLAGEITVWYQDILCEKHGQRQYHVSMFRNVMDFLYRFESCLSDLKGKLLSTLENSDYNDE